MVKQAHHLLYSNSGDTKLLCNSMKFSMILSRFLKNCYLEKIPPEYLTR
jgi:hypothetical protein